MPASNYGQLLVNTISTKATQEVVKEYTPIYADNFVNAHVKWKTLAMQLNKSSIEIRISSDSIKDIRKVEAQINGILKNTKNVTWIRSDWDQMQQNIKVNLDRDKANRMGYSKGFVSTSLMVGLDGLPLTKIWEDDYPVEVRLTQEGKGAKSFKTIEDQYITSLSNFSASPLRSFATLSPEWTEGTIVHRNGTRTLTISADNEIGTIASTIFDEIKPQIDNLKLPEGTSINYGGDFEGQIEVFTPMTIALGLSIVIIFFILMFQFKKVRLSLLIMSTMLLGLPGAAIGLKLVGYPFSLTAFIGITSLCGMVVRNGIILIDYARELTWKSKMPIKDAAIAAGKRRMRPIFLTSAAASVGVIPMIMSGSNLWGPLGTVICFGLLISMVLTLYILPILYSLAYSDKVKKPGKLPIPAKSLIVLLLLVSFTNLKTEAQPLSLDSCKYYALEHNKQIKEAKYKVEESEQVEKNAYTNFFPKVNAQMVAMRANDYLLNIKTPEMNLPVYDGNLANLANATEFAYIPAMEIKALDYVNIGMITASQPIYAGGRIRSGYQLASLGKKINEEALILSTQDVIVKTEEYYWSLVSLNAKRKTLAGYESLLNNLLKDVQVSYKAGLIQKSDLLKVELKINEITTNKLKLKNGISLLGMALCQHIGIQYSESIVLKDTTFSIVSPQMLYKEPGLALSNKSEYQLLNKVIDAEILQKRLARGEFLPQLAVSFQGQYLDIADNNNTYGIALATLSIPISDWWGGSHKIQEHNIKINIAKNNLEEKSELLKLQMEKAFKELSENFQQIKVAESIADQAKEHLKIVNDNYQAGIMSTSDLLEAQAIFQESVDGLVDARSNYQIRQVYYKQAVAQLVY